MVVNKVSTDEINSSKCVFNTDYLRWMYSLLVFEKKIKKMAGKMKQKPYRPGACLSVSDTKGLKHIIVFSLSCSKNFSCLLTVLVLYRLII
jgi:hypothetical protein